MICQILFPATNLLLQKPPKIDKSHGLPSTTTKAAFSIPLSNQYQSISVTLLLRLFSTHRQSQIASSQRVLSNIVHDWMKFKFFVCLHGEKKIYIYVETPRDFIVANFSIRKPGSSSVLILAASLRVGFCDEWKRAFRHSSKLSNILIYR